MSARTIANRDGASTTIAFAHGRVCRPARTNGSSGTSWPATSGTFEVMLPSRFLPTCQVRSALATPTRIGTAAWPLAGTAKVASRLNRSAARTPRLARTAPCFDAGADCSYRSRSTEMVAELHAGLHHGRGDQAPPAGPGDGAARAGSPDRGDPHRARTHPARRALPTR